MDLEKKLEELGRAFEEFKSANDQRLAEIAKKGSASALTEEKVNKANVDIERLTKERDDLVKQIQEIKTAMARPAMGGKEKAETEANESKAAFNRYLRRDVKGMNDSELKALSVGDDANGGYLVQPAMSAEVVKKVFESSPLRQLASVEVISSDSLEMLSDLDEVGSGWVAETGSRSETDSPELKKIIIPVHELHASPKATQKLLDDASWNVEAWLAQKVAEKFARDEATAFITGSGVGKPRGIMSYSNGTTFGTVEQINSGSAGALTANGLLALFYGLKGAYAANASFLMKRSTVLEVRKLVDGTGSYLWQPGLQAGAPALILGKPYYEADDVASVSAGNLAIAFGDFKQAYKVVDRMGTRVLRDQFSSKPYITFYTTKRVGGDVVNFEAFKIQKVSA